MVLMCCVTVLVSACSTRTKSYFPLDFSLDINMNYDLVKLADDILRFEVLDDISKNNSLLIYKSDQPGVIDSVCSAFKVKVLNSLDKNIIDREIVIYANEAIGNNYHYLLANSKVLEKGERYYAFVCFDDKQKAYKVINHRSALIYDDFWLNDDYDFATEFYALVNLHPEAFSDNPEGRQATIWEAIYSYGIIDFFDMKTKIMEIDDKLIQVWWNYLDGSGDEIIEYRGQQFQVRGRFMSE